MRSLILFVLMMVCPLLPAAEPNVVPLTPVDGVVFNADESPELCRGPVREAVKAVASAASKLSPLRRVASRMAARDRQPVRRIFRATAGVARAKVQRARPRRA